MLSGNPISFVEGANTQLPVTVANLPNPSGDANGGDFNAQIIWGNGQTTSGMVTAGSTNLQVAGSTSYAEEGTFPINTTVTGPNGT
jgi:hypothetical protein